MQKIFFIILIEKEVLLNIILEKYIKLNLFNFILYSTCYGANTTVQDFLSMRALIRLFISFVIVTASE